MGLRVRYTFTAADAGVHTFSATLKTSGSQSISVADPLLGAYGTHAGILIQSSTTVSKAITGPIHAVAGTTIPVTVTIRDAYGNIPTGYLCKVKFTTNDTLAKMPVDYSFTPADAGVHAFDVTLKFANTKTNLANIKVVDASNAALAGSLSGMDVINGAAASISLAVPTNITAGVGFTLKVTMLDAFGNNVQNYSGALHFSDSLAGVLGLPADYTFTAADGGVHSFVITLNSASTLVLTLTDVADPKLTVATIITPKAASGGGGGKKPV